MVRTAAFQAVNPGSIPGRVTSWFLLGLSAGYSGRGKVILMFHSTIDTGTSLCVIQSSLQRRIKNNETRSTVLFVRRIYSACLGAPRFFVIGMSL